MGDGFPFDILLFAMIAAFLVFRLRSVLGRRTGHEKHPPEHLLGRDAEIEKDDEEKVIHLPGSEAASPEDEAGGEALAADGESKTEDKTIAGMIEISSADPDFDPDAFMKGCVAAFEIIVEAFAAGDESALRSLLNDEVYADFTSAIKARKEAGETLETTLIGVKTMEILEAELEGKIAVITVKFVSEQINVTRDSEGEVIDGDPDYISEVTDIWTFARNTGSRDPNWTLTATRSSN